MEVAYCERLAQTEMVHVDHQTLGDLRIEGFDFELAHGKREAYHRPSHPRRDLRSAPRNLHHDGLVGINLKEVDVEESVLHGLELQLFHHNLDVLAVELEVYLEDVGSVDELAYILTPDCDVGEMMPRLSSISTSFCPALRAPL